MSPIAKTSRPRGARLVGFCFLGANFHFFGIFAPQNAPDFFGGKKTYEYVECSIRVHCTYKGCCLRSASEFDFWGCSSAPPICKSLTTRVEEEVRSLLSASQRAIEAPCASSDDDTSPTKLGRFSTHFLSSKESAPRALRASRMRAIRALPTSSDFYATASLAKPTIC